MFALKNMKSILATIALALLITDADWARAQCSTTPYVGPTLSFPIPIDATVRYSATDETLRSDFDPGMVYQIDSPNPMFGMVLFSPKGLQTSNDLKHYVNQMKTMWLKPSQVPPLNHPVFQHSLSDIASQQVIVNAFTGTLLSATFTTPISDTIFHRRAYTLIGEHFGIQAVVFTFKPSALECAEEVLLGVAESEEQEQEDANMSLQGTLYQRP